MVMVMIAPAARTPAPSLSPLQASILWRELHTAPSQHPGHDGSLVPGIERRQEDRRGLAICPLVVPGPTVNHSVAALLAGGWVGGGGHVGA